MKALLARFRAWSMRRRQRAQRRDTQARLFRAWARLDEARNYVARDRAAERKERDRLVRQIDAARARLAELEDLLRTYIAGQSLIDASHAAQRAREAVASGFGDLDQGHRGPG